jgi:hypothetical protein
LAGNRAGWPDYLARPNECLQTKPLGSLRNRDSHLLVRKLFGKAGFSRIPDDDLRCLVPCRAGSKGGFDLRDQGIVDHYARFEVQRLDLKNTFFAVGFGVEATDQRIVVQDRQGEVAVFAFGRGRIHLDLAVEFEQVQGPPAPGPTRAGQTAIKRSSSSGGISSRAAASTPLRLSGWM